MWFGITEREDNILFSFFVVAVDGAPANQIMKHPVKHFLQFIVAVDGALYREELLHVF